MVGIDTSLRLLRLRALIDHPRTGDSERAAAQRMLDRILTSSAARVSSDTRSYGARYNRIGKHAGVATVAEMIRADIELMRALASTPAAAGGLAVQDPIGDAPADIAFAVDTPHDFGIVVTINRIPREWGWVSEDGIVSTSPALRALADALADVMNSYNHDGQDGGARFFAPFAPRAKPWSGKRSFQRAHVRRVYRSTNLRRIVGGCSMLRCRAAFFSTSADSGAK